MAPAPLSPSVHAQTAPVTRSARPAPSRATGPTTRATGYSEIPPVFVLRRYPHAGMARVAEGILYYRNRGWRGLSVLRQ